MIDWVVEPFGKRHQRSGFSCGKRTLDDFIRARVSQYEKRQSSLQELCRPLLFPGRSNYTGRGWK